ncbi:MAG: helix-turn-helix transcriptional regulator [Ruminococcus sp.]|nr:helix-turn-helix transcriptional regulator [Ruminococcus sp.]
MSINKFADMAELRQSSIDNIFNGRTKNPGTVNLHKIAMAFSMTIAEFLDFE